MKTVLFIDGRNLLGKFKEILSAEGTLEEDLSNYDWSNYDFKGLFGKVLEGIVVDEKRIYFCKLKVHQDTWMKSKQLIEEQRKLKTKLEAQGFTVILAGSVRGNYVDDGNGKGKRTLVFKEKGADVSIAVDMVTMSCEGSIKTSILASSDSDMQPAIKSIKSKSVESIYLGFEINPNIGLTATNNKAILIRNSEVVEFKKEAPLELPLTKSEPPTLPL